MLAWKQLDDFLKNSQNFWGKTQFSFPKKLTENPKTEYLSTFVDRGSQKSAQKISLVDLFESESRDLLACQNMTKNFLHAL